jgi:hypothetical protein
VPVQTTLYVTYHIGDSKPLQFGKIPITNGMATADTGITSYGMWQWNSLVAVSPNGSTTDLTPGMLSVFGPSVTVTSAQGNLAGNACQ